MLLFAWRQTVAGTISFRHDFKGETMTKVQVREMVRAKLRALGEPEVTDEWIDQLYVRVLLLQALGRLAYQPDRQAVSGSAVFRSLRKPRPACAFCLCGGSCRRSSTPTTLASLMGRSWTILSRRCPVRRSFCIPPPRRKYEEACDLRAAARQVCWENVCVGIRFRCREREINFIAFLSFKSDGRTFPREKQPCKGEPTHLNRKNLRFRRCCRPVSKG